MFVCRSGYQRTAALIATPLPRALCRTTLLQLCADIKHAHQDWKQQTNFIAPVAKGFWDVFLVQYRGLWILLILVIAAVLFA